MEKQYGEFIGVDSLYYALLTKDDSTGYTAGTPEYLAPTANIGAAVTVNKMTRYFDNVAATSYVTEGETEITALVANVPAKVMAKILGKFYDAASGRVIDAGVANPPDCALGFRFNMGADRFRYFWFLKGTFAGGEEASETKTDDVNPNNYELTFTAVPSTYKFTVNGSPTQVKRVFGDTADDAFNPASWFSQVQVPGAVTPSALELSSIVPADGATSVARASTIVLTFNNKIASESISLINSTSGDAVAFTKSWDATGKILTLTPSATMAATTKHIVAVNGVTDIYGQVLAATGKDFTTAA
jgi:phi13 family phage major tail protein